MCTALLSLGFSRSRRVVSLALIGIATWSNASSAVAAPSLPDGPAASPGLSIDAAQIKRSGDGYEAPVTGGGRATLTLDPRLQETADGVFAENAVPYGAAVVISINDGKILALSGYSDRDRKLGAAELALAAWAPSASVFKVVSAAALVSTAGLTPASRTCYHGGSHAIDAGNLRDDARLDTQCETLEYAVAKSQNAIIGKLAARHLTPTTLGRVARDFGFGQKIPFVAEVEPSGLALPSDRVEFARAAAGFFHTSLSPLHGALLAATVGNRGLMPRPRLVAQAVNASGRPLPAPEARARRVLGENAALQVSRMMEATTRMGTGKGTFTDGRGNLVLPFGVAGKTGSLNYRGREGDPVLPSRATGEDFLQYSWFVGFAPYHNPEIAFAVVIGNPAKWRIKAAFVARRLIEEWSAGRDAHDPRMIAKR